MEKKQHSQNSMFFAQQKNYLSFEEYLAANNIDPRKVPFTELSFNVCGYGYFEKYKQNMKLKFKEYLWGSTKACLDLSALKIVFNGFTVNSSQQEREEAQQLKLPEDHILLDIIQAVEDIVRKRKIKVFHFHTTNLRKCSEKDLIKLFNLVNVIGNQECCEEISIQMADWEFENGYPEYLRLVQIFTDFVTSKPQNLKFKKFRLEMSSWYMKEKEAYKFLSKTLTTEQLVQKFKKEQKAPNPTVSSNPPEQAEQQVMQEVEFPHLPAQQREETMNSLVYFLQNIDKRATQPKYPHKKTSQQFDREQFNAHNFMLQEMARTQSIVSKRLVKYPNEFISQARVQQFHNKMTFFLSNLLLKLNVLQEYHIDMRNWHALLSMPTLKKMLDTKVISNKQEYSLIRRSLTTNNKVVKEGDEPGLKTIYTM